MGPGSERIEGFLHNTQLFEIMKTAWSKRDDVGVGSRMVNRVRKRVAGLRAPD